MELSSVGEPFLKEDMAHGSLIDKINQRMSSSAKFFSLEFYPPRTPSGTFNLLEKCDRFMQGNPLFCEVTCDMKSLECLDSSGKRLLALASATQDLCGVDTMLQLNCSNIDAYKALEILYKAKCLGLRNILAMKEGDSIFHVQCALFTSSSNAIALL